MDIRRLLVLCDTVNSEGGLPAIRPVTRVAACAVIRNSLAGVARDDLGELVPLGAELGDLLVRKALAVLPNAPVSYGKAAIVGLDGDIEHAAAILHPRMGKPMREAIGGGQAIIPRTSRSPRRDRDRRAALRRTMCGPSMTSTPSRSLVPGAPRPGEIVVIVVLGDRGRPRPRIDKDGARPLDEGEFGRSSCAPATPGQLRAAPSQMS